VISSRVLLSLCAPRPRPKKKRRRPERLGCGLLLDCLPPDAGRRKKKKEEKGGIVHRWLSTSDSREKRKKPNGGERHMVRAGAAREEKGKKKKKKGAARVNGPACSCLAAGPARFLSLPLVARKEKKKKRAQFERVQPPGDLAADLSVSVQKGESEGKKKEKGRTEQAWTLADISRRCVLLLELSHGGGGGEEERNRTKGALVVFILALLFASAGG